MVVDDHHMVRDGLAEIIKANHDLLLVGTAANGSKAIYLYAECKPDVILMDLLMQGTDGITAIQTIRKNHPNISIIALTCSKDEDLAHKALQAGISGFVNKNDSINEITDTIRAVHAIKTTIFKNR